MGTTFKLGTDHVYEVHSNKEYGFYTIEADQETDVRHWVINHLDLSQDWYIVKVK